MNLLAIDSSCSILSVAAARKEEIHYLETEAGSRHSELVMEYIDSLMKKASLKPNDLDGVLCMGGPGSFTGLRIGFSIAKGLALSLSIPFLPVPTLDCIAYPHRSCGIIIPVIEAVKKAWFFAVYNGDKQTTAASQESASGIAAVIEKLKPAEPQKIILTGPGSSSLYDSFPDDLRKNIIPAFENRGYSRELIAIAKKTNLLDNNCGDLLYSGPEYIRKTDAELNLGKT